MLQTNFAKSDQFVPGDQVPYEIAAPTPNEARFVGGNDRLPKLSESFSSHLIPNTSCLNGDEVHDQTDLAGFPQTMKQNGCGLATCLPQDAAKLKYRLPTLPSGTARVVQGENEVISDKHGDSQGDTVNDLLINLYFRRAHCYPTHLSDRKLMLRVAYALIFDLLGNGCAASSKDIWLHGPNLSMDEHGNFLLAEFDRLMDAFETGLGDFRRFRELPTRCAVQRSAFSALLYVLARAMECRTPEAWLPNLTAARSFLLESADFTYPTRSPAALEFRAAISPSNLSRSAGLHDSALQRYAACGLILRRWQCLQGLFQTMNLKFSLADRFPQIMYRSGNWSTNRMPRDLWEVAGPCARCYGAGMDEQLETSDYPSQG